MNDAIAVAGLSRELTVNGRTYRLHDLSLTDLGRLQAWVDRQFRDPLEVVTDHLERHKDRLPIEVAKFLVRDAREAACKPKPRLGMAEANAQILSVDGLQEILWMCVAKGDPAFTRDDAAELCRHLTFDQASAIIDRTGILELPKDGSSQAPKA